MQKTGRSEIASSAAQRCRGKLMRINPALLLAISAIEFGPECLFAQESAPTPQYRLVQVVEAPTLLEKVNEAARDGYRLAGVTPASGGTTLALLERPANLEGAYGYAMLEGKGDATLQQALNDAGANGFRLLSRDVALDWRMPAGLKLRDVVVWMEKPPGHLKKYEYVVIGFGVKMSLKAGLNPKLWADFNALDYVKSEINTAESRGFRLVRIVSGVALVMEKGGLEEEQTPSPEPSDVAYRSLTTLNGPKLQRKLREKAVGGYCVVDMDPMAPVMWPSILLDKRESVTAGGASEECTYEVIQKSDMTEDDLNQAGVRGFRLVPQSVNFYGIYQSRSRTKPKVNAVFEKVSAANQAYHYRDILAPQISELPDKLEQVGAEGYRAVKVDSLRDGAVLVIMQKSERTGK
jgi:hypothetical protein